MALFARRVGARLLRMKKAAEDLGGFILIL